jgi:ArsR family transcriptional regulator
MNCRAAHPVVSTIDIHRCLAHNGPMPTDTALLPLATSTDACCTTPVARALGEADAAALAARLKALADPTRLRLLSIIAAHPGAEACVCDLTDPVGLAQPTVSHHLRLLVEAGLLTRDKRGVWAYYRLVPGAVDAAAGDLAAALAPAAS